MRLFAAIALLLLTTLTAHAQGCGQGNPNCVAPTPPITPTCDSSNRIANTAFVAACASGTAGVGSLNSLTGAVNITAGSNVTVTPSGQNIQISSTGGGGGGLSITRAQIQSNNLSGVSSLVLVGFSSPNDAGSGAPMTCVGQTSTSIGAIQDSASNWCAFDIERVRAMGGFRPGWFGAHSNNTADSTPIPVDTTGVPSFQRAIDASNRSGVYNVFCNGTFQTPLPIYDDGPTGLRGLAAWVPPSPTVPPTATGYGQGAIALQIGGTTPYTVNSNPAFGAWGSPPNAPDATGWGQDFAYQIVASTSSVTYNPTLGRVTSNAVVVASFKGSGTIGVPTVIASVPPYQNGGSATTTIATAPINSTIVVAIRDADAGGGITGVTDSAGHTYTQAVAVDNGTLGGIYIFFSSNIGSALPSGGTITASGPSAYAIIAVSVTNANNGLDKFASQDNTSSPGNSPTVSTGVLAQANEIVFGAMTGSNVRLSDGYVEAPGFTTTTPGLWSAATWSAGTTYSLANSVVRNGIPWTSLQNSNLGHDPQNDLASNADLVWWKPISFFDANFNVGGTVYGPPQLTPGATLSGCVIRPNFNNSVGFVMGQGNGRTLDSLTVYPNGSGTSGYCQQPITGAGIAILSGTTGANRTLGRNVGVVGFYWGVHIGQFNIQGIGVSGGLTSGLAAENKFENLDVIRSCVGFYIVNSQGFINNLTNVSIDATTAIWVPKGPVAAAVFNGNISHTQTSNATKLPISAIAASYDANSLKFTGTLSLAALATDPWMSIGCADPGGAQNNYTRFTVPCHRNVYNAWILKTAHYGLIPCVMVAFNTNTGVATWRVLDEWLQNYGGITAGPSSLFGSAILTEIQAQTNIWAAETSRTFVGAGISADQIHVETLQPYGLVDSTWENSGAPMADILKNFNLNTEYTFSQAYSPGNAVSEAQFFAAQVFPFIKVGFGANTSGAPIILDNICCNTYTAQNGYGEVMMVDLANQVTAGDGRLIIKGGNLNKFNFRYPASATGNGNMTGGNNNAFSGSAAFGQGDYETTPWVGTLTDANGGDQQMRSMGWASGPYWGVRPAPWTTPCISPRQYANLTGAALPTITNSGLWVVNYPLLWSGQQYRICNWNLTPTAFNAGTTYGIGDLVTSVSITYVSRVNSNVGNTPASSPTQWAPFHYGFVSNHGVGFSYGQNITTTNMPGLSWSINNNSPFVQVASSNAGTLFFPGSTMNLAGTQAGCTTQENFIVREAHWTLGYYGLLLADADNGGGVVPQFGATLCSNTVINQAPYAITTLN